MQRIKIRERESQTWNRRLQDVESLDAVSPPAFRETAATGYPQPSINGAYVGARVASTDSSNS
jgi:hypothetical protein